jgi:hypothetical protein
MSARERQTNREREIERDRERERERERVRERKKLERERKFSPFTDTVDFCSIFLCRYIHTYLD